MGRCVICGEPAGFIRTTHRACRARFKQGKYELADLVARSTNPGQNAEGLIERIEELRDRVKLDTSAFRSALVSGWGKAVERALDDGVLSKDEEEMLAEIRSKYGLSQSDLDAHGAYTRLVQGGVLRDLMNGDLVSRVDVLGGVPFNLQKSEQLIWVFQGTEYFEDRTRTRYVGGSQGMSVRIAKGVYYRTSAFKGERVQSSERVHVDTGILGVTNKHLYFSGPAKSFRIRHDKVVTFEPYSDGIGLHRDAASAKPQAFVTGEGWFTYNLIVNAARL